MVKLDKIDLISHINRLEDKNEIRKVIDKLEIVLKNYTIEPTDFLTPHEINLAISVLNRFKDEISYTIYGGYEDAESNIIIIYPHFLKSFNNDFIAIFKFKSNKKIKHSDILGSLIGLSIERRKIGDILIGENFTYFFVKREISSFIEYNLSKISKYNISLENVDKNEKIDIPQNDYYYKTIIASSFRIDNLISKVFNLSRSKVKKLILSELVKVNFSIETRPHYELEEGDLISVRKHGRFKVYDVKGNTKKGNYIIEFRLNK